MDQKISEDEENLLTKTEISPKSVHKGIKEFSCYLCNKSFVRNGHLQIHITTVHQGIKNHSCDLCDKSYGKKRSPSDTHNYSTSRYQELLL